jgi:cystathionine beta-lyase family protein involved in aluminum resistance
MGCECDREETHAANLAVLLLIVNDNDASLGVLGNILDRLGSAVGVHAAGEGSLRHMKLG